MPKDLIPHLSVLLSQWDKIAFHCKASQMLENEFSNEQSSYLAGTAFGMETAFNELSVVLAKVLSEATKLEPSLM